MHGIASSQGITQHICAAAKSAALLQPRVACERRAAHAKAKFNHATDE